MAGRPSDPARDDDGRGDRIADEVLDEILTLQLVVAWAGEAQTEPPRLGWWRTALHDPLQGQDLFARLLPRTAAWATLEVARLAARKVDAVSHGQASDPDGLRSLFRLGAGLDEQLDDRLAAHKRHAAAPADVLALPLPLDVPLDRAALAAWLAARAETHASIEPSAAGRRLRGEPPADPLTLARALAAALVPLAAAYPAPHYRVGR